MKLNRRNVAPRKLVSERKQKPNIALGKRRPAELPRRERNAWPSRWKRRRAARKKPAGALKKQLARALSRKRRASARRLKLRLSGSRRKPHLSAQKKKRAYEPKRKRAENWRKRQ